MEDERVKAGGGLRKRPPAHLRYRLRATGYSYRLELVVQCIGGSSDSKCNYNNNNYARGISPDNASANNGHGEIDDPWR